MLRIASVPDGHVHVRHLSCLDGEDDIVVRLPDPPTHNHTSQSPWWPPPMPTRDWPASKLKAFDVADVQFGLDAIAPGELAALNSELNDELSDVLGGLPDLELLSNAQQSLENRHAQSSFHRASLVRAVQFAYDDRPRWQASYKNRRQQQRPVAASHRDIYQTAAA